MGGGRRKLDASELPSGSTEDGFVATVHLANGTQIVGERELLVDGLMESAETHNREHGL